MLAQASVTIMRASTTDRGVSRARLGDRKIFGGCERRGRSSIKPMREQRQFHAQRARTGTHITAGVDRALTGNILEANIKLCAQPFEHKLRQNVLALGSGKAGGMGIVGGKYGNQCTQSRQASGAVENTAVAASQYRVELARNEK